MNRVAIIQPSYLPWKGFFDLIHDVDTFIFLDDVQYTVRDWRSRNKIKQHNGSTVWLTVPVLGGRSQLIRDVQIDNSQDWKRRHLEAIRHAYSKTPFFDEYFAKLSPIFSQPHESLSELDIILTQAITEWLSIKTKFLRSSELGAEGTRDARLINLLKKVNATYYLSGPSARDYIDPANFANAEIELAYKDYTGYPEYPQISLPFEPAVSILDLLFSMGGRAPDYIWGWR